MFNKRKRGTMETTMYNNKVDVSSYAVHDFVKEENQTEEQDIFYEDNLRDLICKQFGFCEEVYIRLVECGMDIESLSLIKEDDIKELFPISMMGTRIKFRTRVTQWQQLGNNKITSFPTPAPTPTSTRVSSIGSPVRSFEQDSLYTILKSTSKGQSVLKFYEQNSKLLDHHRVALISVIVDEYKDRSLSMTMTDIVRFTEEIGVLFPTEEKKYYYSTRGKGRNPMGKLYDKAINARRKIRKLETVSSYNKVPKNDVIEVVATKDELDKKLWLSHYQEPLEEVLEKWKLTFRIRRAEISKGENVLLNWPLFKTSWGYTLVDIDFAEMFPENAMGIFNGWPYFRESIVPYLREKIKDHDAKELLEKLNEDMSEDSKDCLIVLLLHAVIKPPLLSTKLICPEGSNKRRKWKPTISDAQNATILHCTSLQDYHIKYEQLKSKACQKNKIIQPLLLVIGEELTKLDEFYVLYDDSTLYKVPSFIKSLDILFKLYSVMNIEYRLAAKYLYELIESYFFKIKTSSNPNIISLTNYLNDNKSVTIL